MIKTPRTDAHQSACLRSGGRSCEGGRNAYWLARQLERENVQMREIIETLSRYPVASVYPDGPCIERSDMDDIRAILRHNAHVDAQIPASRDSESTTD